MVSVRDVDERIEARKADHLRLSASGDVDALVGPGWDDVRLVHEALPESTRRRRPVGGVPRPPPERAAAHCRDDRRTPTARDVNAVLARAAERHGLAMGVGSQRAALRQAGPGLYVYGRRAQEAPRLC